MRPSNITRTSLGAHVLLIDNVVYVQANHIQTLTPLARMPRGHQLCKLGFVGSGLVCNSSCGVRSCSEYMNIATFLKPRTHSRSLHHQRLVLFELLHPKPYLPVPYTCAYIHCETINFCDFLCTPLDHAASSSLSSSRKSVAPIAEQIATSARAMIHLATEK